jgi:CubicO group peptidase (beta-lactamase class C family)
LIYNKNFASVFISLLFLINEVYSFAEFTSLPSIRVRFRSSNPKTDSLKLIYLLNMKIITGVSLLLCLHLTCLAQQTQSKSNDSVISKPASLPDSIKSRIDNVFKSFNDKTPGCAIAILKNGELVFEKGYGMANLEYSIPNSPKTIFHIASESKQYVAFCMLLLEKEGKLSLDDDIRKYLDYVPDFHEKITIKHLIYHTSGLRDQWQLLANAGWQLDDVITQEHVIKLVSKQKELNFKPGEEHMYCNTGYTLMAEIVKKVSGLTLRQYTEKFIFGPLGMNDTHFHDNYQELVPNRAYSYTPNNKGGYQHAVLSYSIVGATSLLTTVEDETKWLNNFATGQVGGKELIQKMHTVGVLNDGRKLSYAFAIFKDKFKGWDQIGHGGGDAGFRTYACRYPEKGIGIVVFSNSGFVNPGGLVSQVAGLLITDTKNEVKPATNTNFADSNFLKKMEGKYYSARGDLGEMYWKDGKFYRAGRNRSNPQESRLVIVTPGRYVSASGGPVIIVDPKNIKGDSVLEITMESTVNSVVFKRMPPALPKITAEYAGRYYSAETEAFYTVTELDGKLTLEHRKFANANLTLIAPDQFTTPNWWMNHIRFIRDKDKKITGFEVNSGRILGLKYQKL